MWRLPFTLVKKVPAGTRLENLPPPTTCAILIWKLGLKDPLENYFCIAKLTRIPLMQNGFVVHYSLHHQMTVSKLIQSHGPDDSGTVFSIAQWPSEAFSEEIFKRSAFQGYTIHFVSQIFKSTTPLLKENRIMVYAVIQLSFINPARRPLCTSLNCFRLTINNVLPTIIIIKKSPNLESACFV